MKGLMILVLALNVGCATAANLKELHPGMTGLEVQDHLGKPKSKETIKGVQREVYGLKMAPKPVQAILAYPTLGIIFAFEHEYIVEYDDSGKLTNYYRR